MNNTILALEVLWKIAGNLFFNQTAAGIIVFFAIGISVWSILDNRDANY